MTAALPAQWATMPVLVDPREALTLAKYEIDLADHRRHPFLGVIHARDRRHVRRDGGGVDQNIDPSMLFAGIVDVALHIIGFGQVDRVDAFEIEAFGARGANGRFRPFLGDVAADHGRPFAREHQADALTDARTDTGHQRNLARETSAHVDPSVACWRQIRSAIVMKRVCK
jgi:hypothetical protein